MATQSGVVVGRSVSFTESVTFGNGVTVSASVTIPVDPNPPSTFEFYAPLTLETNFDDIGGGAANTPNGTISVAASAEFPGGAYQSDGSVGNYVSYAIENGDGEFNFPGDFTVSFSAVKTADTAGGYDSALAFGNGSGTNGFVIELSSVRGFVIVYNGATIITHYVDPNDGIVHDYEWGRIGADMHLKIDGAIVSSLAYPGTIANTSPTLILGSYNGSDLGVGCFKGQLQEMIISKA